MVAPWIEEQAGAELDALGLTIDDQAAYATLARRLLEDLDLADADERAEEQPEEGGEDEQGEDEGPDEEDDAEAEGGAAGGEMEMRSDSEERDEGEEDGQSEREEEGEATRRRRGRRAGADQPVAAQLAGRADRRLSRIYPALRRSGRGGRAVRPRGIEPAARLSRPADGAVAGRGDPARQPAGAAADGAAGAQLGLRPGRRHARRRAAGARGGLARRIRCRTRSSAKPISRTPSSAC